MPQKNESRINQIFRILSETIKEPETELIWQNRYQLLVAITLSAQSTDVSVNKATKSLFEKVQTPEDMLKLGKPGLISHIKTIGLFNSKAENIMKMSEILINCHQSKVPENFENLIKLPGVGRKTANVWLNCAMGLPTIAVDTHVGRLARRLGISKQTNPDLVEIDLLKKIPKKWHKIAHHLMILHGRYICKSQKPQCQTCPINHLCPSKQS